MNKEILIHFANKKDLEYTIVELSENILIATLVK